MPTLRAASVSVRPSKNVPRSRADSFSGKAESRSRRNITNSRWSDASPASASLDIKATFSRSFRTGRRADDFSVVAAAGVTVSAAPPCPMGEVAVAAVSEDFRSYWRPSNAARSNQVILPKPSSIAPRMRYHA